MARPPGNQNPTSGAKAGYRTHVMRAGDTLASVAYEAYGDPGRWRTLAEANDIDDPTRVPAGRSLLVPGP
jgi:nucleoid-associated protein YgaU